MSDDILVSIAVITYNQEKYIGQTLDSLLNQQGGFRFEIVVGEDASSDGTRAVIESYRDKHPDIINLLPKSPNKGLVRNFRDTIRNCGGKYITICAGDDFWHNPSKLEKQVHFLEANPDYGLVHTDLNMFVEKSGQTIENYNSKNQHHIRDGEVFDDLVTSRFFIAALTVCFNKSLFDKYVSYDEFEREGFTYEDLPTWLELSKHTRFKYLEESTATYRLLENSVSHPKDALRKFDFMAQHHKIKSYFLKKYNAPPGIAEEFETIYHQRKFNLAYKLKNNLQADDSFDYLKSKKQATVKIKLKKMVLDFPVLYKLVGVFKKLVVSKPVEASL